VIPGEYLLGNAMTKTDTGIAENEMFTLFSIMHPEFFRSINVHPDSLQI
jgi:hypothetical protein